MPSISSQDSFKTSEYCLHHDIFTKFLFLGSLKVFFYHSINLTVFLAPGSRVDVRKDKWWFSRVCIKESRAALLRVLYVFGEVFFNFRFSIAQFETTSTAICYTPTLEHAPGQNYALSAFRASFFRRRLAAVFDREKKAP